MSCSGACRCKAPREKYVRPGNAEASAAIATAAQALGAADRRAWECAAARGVLRLGRMGRAQGGAKRRDLRPRSHAAGEAPVGSRSRNHLVSKARLEDRSG